MKKLKTGYSLYQAIIYNITQIIRMTLYFKNQLMQLLCLHNYFYSHYFLWKIIFYVFKWHTLMSLYLVQYKYVQISSKIYPPIGRNESKLFSYYPNTIHLSQIHHFHYESLYSKP